jgi:hypothetical protein
MASTILVNTINTQSGSTITVPAGKTLAITDAGALTIGGTAITTGSTNIQRKTADYTIVSGDITAKSHLVITANASAATRTITLPANGTTGLATCMISIMADASATSTYKLQVLDASSTEIWTGYEKSDFVTIIETNNAWVVLNHKETLFEHRYLTANQDVPASTFNKFNASTSITSIGNMWDSTNNRLVVPCKCFLDIWVQCSTTRSNEPSASAGAKIGPIGSLVTMFQYTSVNSDGRVSGPTPYINRHVVDTSGDVAEAWMMSNDSDQTVTWIGGSRSVSQFAMTLTRRY